LKDNINQDCFKGPNLLILDQMSFEIIMLATVAAYESSEDDIRSAACRKC